ncbi:MAG: methyltransferase domain-containing protein [Dokdonella sp.]|nr:methyltransferase domain-containing protein [Dokdonella sp.]MCB1572344.1 methyltransferase domain-containing protein [Xanthomonadales bacterium]MCB1577975.1 methyltransferase domain-containing protein [Xanthomonadales bacterium]
MHLVPGSIFELAELQHLLAGEWNRVRTRAALVASGHGLLIDPLAAVRTSAISSHPEWTRLHLQGDGLGGDLRCSPDSLPFESDSMQLIVARHVGDMLDPGSGIEAELARVLAPGGMLLLFGLNPLSPWRFWLSRQVRQGWRLPGYRSAGRMRRTLDDCKLSVVGREFLGGAWPKRPLQTSPAGERLAGAIWEGAWLLAARKQRLGMHPIPLRAGRRRVPINHGLAQSPSRRLSS